MIFYVLFGLVLICLTAADEPILHLNPGCPPTDSTSPILHVRADVPAYAKAICQNGDKLLTTTDDVEFNLDGAFERDYVGDHCQYYKKKGSNTYTVDVEIGWGEVGSQVINNKDIKTVSCSYDDHGRALSATQTVSEWFLNPKEKQTLLGPVSKAVFDLQVVDVLGRPIGPNHISIGRKIRLKAVDSSNQLKGFRALSCDAKNEHSSYAILRAGCGDGLVFNRKTGFQSIGAEILSPYFEAFRLRASANIQFECTFTACDEKCDGDSCAAATRRKRRDVRSELNYKLNFKLELYPRAADFRSSDARAKCETTAFNEEYTKTDPQHAPADHVTAARFS